MSTTREVDLVADPIVPTLARLTWPMIFGMLGMVVYNITDTYFIGKLGVAQLAAMGFTFPAVMFISSIVRGIGIGTASLFSRVIVAKNISTVQRYSVQIFIFALTLTVFFVGAGQLTIQPLFQLLGASSDVIPLIREYMVIWYWGIIFLVIPMVGNNMIRATGKTFAPGMIMVFGSIMNLMFDSLLIFGWGPIPALGLQGAAVATVMSRALTLVLSLYVLIYRERLLAISWSSLREMIHTWGKVLYVAGPAAMTILIVPLSIGFITRILAGFGPDAVAAFGVVSRLETFALILISALGSVLTVFAGQNWSAQQPVRLSKALHVSALFSLGLGLFFFLIAQFFSTQIAAVFSSNTRVIRITASYLQIVAFSYGLQGILRLSASILNGINRPTISFLLSLLRMVILYVPLAWITSVLFGLQGIFWSAFAANIVAGSVAWYWLHRIITKRTDMGRSGQPLVVESARSR